MVYNGKVSRIKKKESQNCHKWLTSEALKMNERCQLTDKEWNDFFTHERVKNFEILSHYCAYSARNRKQKEMNSTAFQSIIVGIFIFNCTFVMSVVQVFCVIKERETMRELCKTK
jgi:hypothetical protein